MRFALNRPIISHRVRSTFVVHSVRASVKGRDVHMGSFSRRSFLKGAGVGALGMAGMGALGACSPQSTSDETRDDAAATSTSGTSAWRTAPESVTDIVQTYDCDVLVIGLGHAGSCALRAAAEAGAVAYGMDEHSEESWSYTGFQMGHINSSYLKSKGIPEVDPIEFVNDWQVRSNNRSNPALIMKYAKNCGSTFDWIFNNLNEKDFETFNIMHYKPEGPFKKELSGLKSWVGTATAGGDLLTESLHRCKEAAQQSGGDVLFETKACQLVTDESGAVVGAIGEGPDGYVQVNTAKGVIIATGGFGTNAEMCQDLLYEIKESLGPNDEITNMLDRDGTGIQMGYWAGGRLDPCMGTMDGAYWYPCDSPTDPLGATAALWLNADGKRYCNEGFGSTELMAMPGARQPDGQIVTVFDSNVEELLNAQPFGHMSFDVTGGFDALRTTMEKAYAGGAQGSAEEGESTGAEAGTNKAEGGGACVYAADDLETLGTYLGYEGEALDNFVASIERYNDLCAQGVDEDFGKDPSLMIPVSNPPYYAYGGTKALGVLMVTVAGLLINENGQVLGNDYRPIKGLFAAGNASGSRFGWQYFTSIAGQSLTLAHTLGKMTGEYVASL